MAIVNYKKMLLKAKQEGYAIPSFNTNNLEYTQAIVQAASELHAPVIIGAAQSEIEYMGGPVFTAMVRAMVEDLDIPVGIHLDHGPSIEQVVRCIQYGFSSVMYDGSALPLEQNITNTQRVVELAHACDLCVEAEIGVIGQTSEGPEGPAIDPELIGLADPNDCEALIRASGADCLAAAVGNAHGIYKRRPELRFGLLEEIAQRTGVPLVLHGGTGIPVPDIQKAISLGVAKINFSTVMRKGAIETLRNTLNAQPHELDYMKLLSPAREAMVAIAKEHIQICMCDGKA